MTFITRKFIARRKLRRGLGASIGLPLLDSMIRAMAAIPSAPLRLAFTYLPNGIIMKDWTPRAGG